MERLWQHCACYAAAGRAAVNARPGLRAIGRKGDNDVTATAPQHWRQADNAGGNGAVAPLRKPAAPITLLPIASDWDRLPRKGIS
jgi:hypothetical protein